MYPEFNPGISGIYSQRGGLTVKKLTVSQACDGLVLFKTAAGLSPHTIRNYRNSFKKLTLFFPEDPPFVSITRSRLIAFFAWLQDESPANPSKPSIYVHAWG